MQKQAEVSISICVPTYNRTEYIKEALQSALLQDYPHFEVLVSDDSAHDRIKDIAVSFASPRMRYVKNTPPLGLMPKLNWFLKEAHGDWVVILCDDDRLEPDYLKTLTSLIKQHPDAVLARSRYRLIDHRGILRRLDPENPPVMDVFEATSKVFLPYRQSYAMNVSGVLFKKDILLHAGGFLNLYDGLHSDRLAWAAIGAAGPTLFENKALCSLRIYPGATSGSIQGDYEKRVEAGLALKEHSEKLISDLTGKAQTARDKNLLDEAKKNLNDCVRTSLQASFDKGFRVALSEPGNARERCQKIFTRMKSLEVPLFKSSYLYGMIALLPFGLRKIFMEKIQGVKLGNFERYLKEK